VHPAMSIAALRERVLILGGGDGLALREVLKYRDVEHVTLVDLDPRMTELASRHPLFVALNGGSLEDARVRAPRAAGVRAGERVPVFQERRGVLEEGVEEIARVSVINVDADRFVAALPGLFDVVIIDFPDPSSVELAKLYSREFYRKLRGVLAPEAVVALQSTSPYHAREAFLCIKRTLEAAGYETFPYHDDVPSFGSWGWLLAAPVGAGGESLAKRVAGVESLSVETVYLTPALMARAGVFGKGRLRADRDGVNTLMHPLLLDLYLRASWIGD